MLSRARGCFHLLKQLASRLSPAAQCPRVTLVRWRHDRNIAIKPRGGAPLWFREEDVEEQYMRGGGKGGQSVAKTNNCVLLIHKPTGTVVRCHATRSRDLNRKLARQELQMRLDDSIRGADSFRNQRAARDKKKALKQRSRAKAKYGGSKTVTKDKIPGLSVKQVLRVRGVSRRTVAASPVSAGALRWSAQQAVPATATALPRMAATMWPAASNSRMQ